MKLTSKFKMPKSAACRPISAEVMIEIIKSFADKLNDAIDWSHAVNRGIYKTRMCTWMFFLIVIAVQIATLIVLLASKA